MSKKTFIISVLASILLATLAFAEECVPTLDSQICVGESHDSVITKIDKSYATRQIVNQGPYGPIVDRSYSYHGQTFTLRFERTSSSGPFRLTKIVK